MRSLLTKQNQKMLKKTNLAITEKTDEARKVEVHDKQHFLEMLNLDLDEPAIDEKSDSEIGDNLEIDLFAA
jgi:hypothetical protein